MYFGTSNPDNYVIRASTVSKLIYNYGFNYVTIDGLSLQGGNWAAVHCYQTNYNTIRNCDILFSGAYGIYGETDSNSLTENNSISSCLDQATLL